MQTIEIVAMIFSALGGGIITQVVNYFISSRKEDRSDIQLIVDNLKEDNERLRKETEDNRRRIFDLEKQDSKNQAHLRALDSAHFHHPWPSWVKGLDGEMIVVNRSYEAVFLKPRGYTAEDYLNQRDTAVWPEDIAAEYAENDRWVMRNKEPWQGTENVGTNGGREEWFITKYPLFYNKQIVGIAGMAVPIQRIIKNVSKR